SVDPVDKHSKWSEDIRETQGAAPNYPMIGDTDFKVSKLYDMLPASTSGDAATRTAADNQTVRNVFVIGPDKKIKLPLVYPMTTGRNFQEILRATESLQMTAKHRVATPSDWKQGYDVIIAGPGSDEEKPVEPMADTTSAAEPPRAAAKKKKRSAKKASRKAKTSKKAKKAGKKSSAKKSAKKGRKKAGKKAGKKKKSKKSKR